MTVSSGSTTDTLNYSYDALQRLTSQTTVRTGLTLAEEYSYKNLSGNRTTTQVSGYTAKVNGSVVDTYSYSYDNLGNITVVNRSGNLPVYYTYDAQNQLVSVLEGDFRYDFTYDTYGNILSVEYVEDYTDEVLSSNTYSYTNTQWVDQLMAFNGVGFEYDQIGNPTKYYNGSNYTFTWDGRELATATKGSTSISYKYGADGLRTQKTVGNTVYNYYYIDGVLVRQTWGTNYMDFLYDESGSPYSFIYNGTQYYYVKNLQGDVVKILNTSGSVVANYSYDAWGKVTGSGSIGQINPIRYRGYYYDTDTGFYYLQSRYYDPVVKRFISADGYISTGQGILGFNMYAYCLNNPTNQMDTTGHMAIEAAVVATNWWNPAGWIAAIIAVAKVVIIVAAIVKTVEETAEIVKNVTEATKNVTETQDQSVYVLVDPNDGNRVKYVGRTNDPTRRMYQHQNDKNHKERKNYEMRVVKSNLTIGQAKTLEQVLISAYTLGYLENARREIAVGNVSGFQKNINNIAQIFNGVAEDELKNLMGR